MGLGVCVRERERERETSNIGICVKDREKETEQWEYVCVCVREREREKNEIRSCLIVATNHLSFSKLDIFLVLSNKWSKFCSLSLTHTYSQMRTYNQTLENKTHKKL